MNTPPAPAYTKFQTVQFEFDYVIGHARYTLPPCHKIIDVRMGIKKHNKICISCIKSEDYRDITYASVLITQQGGVDEFHIDPRYQAPEYVCTFGWPESFIGAATLCHCFAYYATLKDSGTIPETESVPTTSISPEEVNQMLKTRSRPLYSGVVPGAGKTYQSLFDQLKEVYTQEMSRRAADIQASTPALRTNGTTGNVPVKETANVRPPTTKQKNSWLVGAVNGVGGEWVFVKDLATSHLKAILKDYIDHMYNVPVETLNEITEILEERSK